MKDMEGKEMEFVDQEMEAHAVARLEEAAKDLQLKVQRRRALVSALKSGRYPQAFRMLRREASQDFAAGFCCLGVACDVAIKDGLGLDADLGADRYTYGTSRDRSQTRLPEAARDWYGFDSGDPYLRVPQRFVEINDKVAQYWNPDWTCVASSLNDDCRLTLEQIGECFQYTFLRDGWEAEHGNAKS